MSSRGDSRAVIGQPTNSAETYQQQRRIFAPKHRTPGTQSFCCSLFIYVLRTVQSWITEFREGTGANINVKMVSCGAKAKP